MNSRGVFVLQLVPILLFCLGPLSQIVAQSPMYVRADVGLQTILAVEHQLDTTGGVTPFPARYGASCAAQIENAATNIPARRIPTRIYQMKSRVGDPNYLLADRFTANRSNSA